jgi:hypothetical protein
MSGRGRRRGAALPFVLVALVVGTVCAAAGASVAREAVREARGVAAAVQTASGAEGALAAVLARWPARWNLELAQGVRVVRDVTTAAGAARVWVVRLDSTRLAVEVEARAGESDADGPAVARRQLLVRLPSVALATGAAITAGGAVRVDAGATVASADRAPEGWNDCPTPAADADVDATAVAAPEVEIEPGAEIMGLVRRDPAAWQGAIDPRFGGAGYAEHAARAHVAVSAALVSPVPVAAAGDAWPEPCVLAAGSWGEPVRGAGAVGACEGALPVVRLRGEAVRLRGPARFQGTILVDGDLMVEGEVRGAGVVVVRGAVDASMGALLLDGALVAGGPVVLGGGSRVRASSCARARAARYAARAVPLARRAWAEVVR